MKSDLHIHTHFSDGAFPPEKVVDAALDFGLDVIALTDHDNVLSHEPAMNYAKQRAQSDNQKELIIVPGVEINTI